MKRWLILIVALVLIVSIAYAKNKPEVLGDEAVAMSGTTVYTLTPATGSIQALVTLSGDTVRWKGYTTNPSGTTGAILEEGDYLFLDSPYQIENFGAILQTGGSSATLYIIYYSEED